MSRSPISGKLLTYLLVPLILMEFMSGTRLKVLAGVDLGPAMPVVTPDERNALRMLQADGGHAILELTPATPEFESAVIDGQPCQNVSIPGLSQAEQPGLPALPVQGAMLGIPQDARPTIQILSAEWVSLPGSYLLCPMRQPVLTRAPMGPWKLNDYSYPRGPAYQQDAFIPANIAGLVSTGNLRSQRFAQVRMSPLRYNPVTGKLRYARRMVVELNFNHPGQVAHLPYINEGAFEDILRSQLLNYDQAHAWRVRPATGEVTAQSTPALNETDAAQSQTVYKIQVDQDGIYQLSYAALQAAGVPVDHLDPRTLRLTNQSNEVAMVVEGETDGVFDATDVVLFYGQKSRTKYTNVNVYWLSWDGALGQRMASLKGAPSGSANAPGEFLTTLHMEIDADYYSDDPSGTNNDHWYWGMVYAYSAPASQDFTTDLRHLSAANHTITVRGLLNGYSATPNHHTRIYLNGHLIDDHTFESGSIYNLSVSVPQSYLVEGTNTIRVECPRDGDITLDAVLVNWFEIDYFDTYFAEGDRLSFDGDTAGTYEFQVDGFSSTSIEAFDITHPLAPLRISGGTVTSTSNGQQLAFEATLTGEQQYLAQTTASRINPLSIIQDNPTNWKSPSNGADYIIITHANFISQVQPLAAFRAGQGLRVQVIDVQDVYDEFNGGLFSPEAIKSFLAYAYANWVAPAPGYVLLVGDGHFDFKNVYGYGETNYIPPYLDDVDPWTGENPTDNRFVSVSGGDILPDMFIGRFPVRTAGEAQTMVEKTINYEQVAPSGGWNARLNFIADNADIGGDFPALSDHILSAYVPSSYAVDKIYYGMNYTSISAARSDIQAAINGGRLIVHYAGHASLQLWASEGLLTVSDLASLTNGSMLPFVMPMACAEGYFVWPSPAGLSSLGESIVRINGRGAIASWSPVGYGLNSGHTLLDDSVFNNLFNHNQNQLGYLTTNAKVDLYANGASYNDLIETYLLFGDPAARLQTLAPPPNAPSDLTASPFSSTQIDLSWQDNSNDETEFRIERSSDGVAGWIQIATVNAGVTTYRDPGRNCATSYFYRLRAYRAGDSQTSAYTSIAEAATYASQAMSFTPGWNLIALPLEPINSYNAETLLAAINHQADACSEIVQWASGGWNTYSAGLPFGIFNIELGEGYFVKCAQAVAWDLEGSPLASSVVVNLSPGWNLVGIPEPLQYYGAQSLLDGIETQGGACSDIVRWENGGWITHSDHLPYQDFTILPNEGYFIRCSTPLAFDPGLIIR